MMDEYKSSKDLDDAEILEKFRSLLSKYQNQGTTISATDNVVAANLTAVDAVSQEIESDKIPVLTEVVILRPSVIQPQPMRSTPMQQILDAALEDANITMNANNRKALANALETRLVDQVR